MGQAQSITETVIPDAVDAVHLEVVRHAKVLSEINALTYEEFKACLDNLNALSRKCIDPQGKQLVFLIKKGTDTSLLWKATVRIACIKVDPETRKIDDCKFLNLKQFLCVFRTFQSHLENLVCSEKQRSSRRGSHTPQEEELGAAGTSSGKPAESSASMLLHRVMAFASGAGAEGSSVSSDSATTPADTAGASGSARSSFEDATCTNAAHDHMEECCICLDRRTEVILPCAHSFCAPCIEQWNVNNKTCPICSETLESTDDTWVLSDMPGVEEINEKICAEFMNLTKSEK